MVEDVNKKVADGEIDADYGYINNKITNNESCRNNKWCISEENKNEPKNVGHIGTNTQRKLNTFEN